MNSKPCPNISLMRAIWIAASLLIMTVIVSLVVSMGLIENQLIIRIIGVAFGFILIVTANYFPKQIFPYPAAKAAHRIAWLFVIAGLFYIIVWMTGDTQRTQPMFSLIFAPACILSMLMYRYAKPNPTQASSTETQS